MEPAEVEKEKKIYSQVWSRQTSDASLAPRHPLPAPLNIHPAFSWHPLHFRSPILAFSRTRNKSVMDGRTDGRTVGTTERQTDPHMEMRWRI